MSKKYVPQGAHLACDKGTCPSTFRVSNHKKTTIYGSNMATEADKKPFLNIKPMGICSVKGGMCIPIVFKWDKPKNGVKIGRKRLLLDDSTCKCLLGGEISIHFDRQSAVDVSLGDGKMPSEYIKQGFDFVFNKIDNVFDLADEVLPDWMSGVTDSLRWKTNAVVGLTEGAINGVVGLGEVIYQVAQDPVGMAEGIAGMAGNAWEWGQKGENWSNAASGAMEWASDTDNWANMIESVAEDPRGFTNFIGEFIPDAVAAGATGGTSLALSAGKTALKESVETVAKKGVKKVVKEAVENAGKKLKRVITKKADDAVESGAKKGDPPSCNKKTCGDPVDVASGEMSFILQGFSLPGPIPLKWEANYYSSKKDYDGPLGAGIYHSYDWRLRVDKSNNIIVLNNNEGRDICFEIPKKKDDYSFNSIDKLKIFKKSQEEYFILSQAGLYYYFTNNQDENGNHKLRSIVNRNAFSIQFHYDNELNLIGITDSCHRKIELTYSDEKIEALLLEHPDNKNEFFSSVKYEYRLILEFPSTPLRPMHDGPLSRKSQAPAIFVEGFLSFSKL